MKKLLIIYIILFSSLKNYCQNNLSSFQTILENIMEQAISLENDDIDIESVVAQLEYYYQHPLNLNSASAEELQRLIVLNDFQIKAFIDYRKSMGKINSLHELTYIYGFTPKIAQTITPFVYLGDINRSDSLHLKFPENKCAVDFLSRAGYKTNTSENSLGSPVQLYTRFNGYVDDKARFGLLAEKDAGEEFASGANKQGFDFYSAHLQVNSKTIVKSIILGDYRVRSGQGLLIWNGYAPVKSSELSSLQKRGQVISTNTSKDEYNFLRGAAAIVSYKALSLYVYGSQKHVDGQMESEKLQGINTSGYHRTETEIERKYNTQETTYGTIINLKTSRMSFSGNWLHIQYDKPITVQEEIYKNYSFTGSVYTGFSGDYSMLFEKVQFFGEIALGNNSFASINGINLMPHSQFNASIFYRNYPASYFSPYANGISENSNPENEQGFFAGFHWQTDWKINLSAYSDIFSYQWLSYSADRPIHGKEYLIELNYSSTNNFETMIRYRFKQKEKNYSPENQLIPSIEAFEKQNLRVQIRYAFSKKINITSRFEWCQSGFMNYNFNPGYLLFNDLIYMPIKSTTVTFRYAFFDSETYDSRIYAYESDVLYSYSVPAYYGKGQKIYLVLRQNFSKKISLWLRYEFLKEFEITSAAIHGIKGQIIMKF